jgi:hypothetical protein
MRHARELRVQARQTWIERQIQARDRSDAGECFRRRLSAKANDNHCLQLAHSVSVGAKSREVR